MTPEQRAALERLRKHREAEDAQENEKSPYFVKWYVDEPVYLPLVREDIAAAIDLALSQHRADDGEVVDLDFLMSLEFQNAWNFEVFVHDGVRGHMAEGEDGVWRWHASNNEDHPGYVMKTKGQVRKLLEGLNQ